MCAQKLTWTWDLHPSGTLHNIKEEQDIIYTMAEAGNHDVDIVKWFVLSTTIFWAGQHVILWLSPEWNVMGRQYFTLINCGSILAEAGDIEGIMIIEQAVNLQLFGQCNQTRLIHTVSQQCVILCTEFTQVLSHKLHDLIYFIHLILRMRH